MILVDANLLIYAIDRDSPHHKPARRWLEGALSGSTTVGLAWGVILAFLRLTATVYSADADFGRFPGLRCVNPLVRSPRPVR